MSFIGMATAPRNIFSNRRSQAQMVAFSVFPKTASIGIWYVTCQKIVLIRLWFFLHELMLRLLAHTIFKSYLKLSKCSILVLSFGES